MLTHTLGPWVIERQMTDELEHTGYCIYALEAGNAYERHWVGDVHGEHVRIPLEQIEANALLMSAAPDMLAELRRLRDVVGAEDAARIDAVIAKATPSEDMEMDFEMARLYVEATKENRERDRLVQLCAKYGCTAHGVAVAD